MRANMCLLPRTSDLAMGSCRLIGLLATTVCLLGTLASGGNVAAVETLRKVAITGDPAPGTSRSFYDLGSQLPSLNERGQTAFGASLSFVDNYGIWSEGGGTLHLLARQGAPASGAGVGAVFNLVTSGKLFDQPHLSDTGQTVFYAGLQQGSGGVDPTNDSGYWIERNGSLQLVARKGDQAPELPAGTPIQSFGNNSSAPMTSSGQLAIFAVTRASNGASTGGIWTESGGSLHLLTIAQNHAPGTPEGVDFYSIDIPAINDSGETAFFASLPLFTPGVTFRNGTGVWAEREGSLHLVARSGDPAPGFPDGNRFIYISYSNGSIPARPGWNNAGQLAFRAALVNESGDQVGNGIWSDRSGASELVVASGDTAPGTAGRVFEYFQQPLLNKLGQTAFFASLASVGPFLDGQREGLWSEGGGSLHLVAHSGTQAPDTPSGTLFKEFDPNSSVGLFTLNGAGQMAFYATLKDEVGGAIVGASNDAGIWAEDRSGVLHLIAREGDQLDVDDGPGVLLKTIGNLNFLTQSGNEDGLPGGFNDRGQLAFRAYFTDNTSGIFVSNLVAVIPEPASVALALLAAAGLFCLVPDRRIERLAEA